MVGFTAQLSVGTYYIRVKWCSLKIRRHGPSLCGSKSSGSEKKKNSWRTKKEEKREEVKMGCNLRCFFYSVLLNLNKTLT